jgi:uncharacterized protein YdiU (UPF0061 family)
MVVHWQRVGFVHGVMNTDNMSILGLTIDYGPYGWLEDYNPNWTLIPRIGKTAGIVLGTNQKLHFEPLSIGQFFVPTEEAAPLESILNSFQTDYEADYASMMRNVRSFTKEENDSQLIHLLTENLQQTETDMTIFFRKLSQN